MKSVIGIILFALFAISMAVPIGLGYGGLGYGGFGGGFGGFGGFGLGLGGLSWTQRINGYGHYGVSPFGFYG